MSDLLRNKYGVVQVKAAEYDQLKDLARMGLELAEEVVDCTAASANGERALQKARSLREKAKA